MHFLLLYVIDSNLGACLTFDMQLFNFLALTGCMQILEPTGMGKWLSFPIALISVPPIHADLIYCWVLLQKVQHKKLPGHFWLSDGITSMMVRMCTVVTFAQHIDKVTLQ